MSALEQEISEKLMALDETARRRMIRMAEQSLLSVMPVSWLDQARLLRAEMGRKYGTLTFSAAQMIDTIREAE